MLKTPAPAVFLALLLVCCLPLDRAVAQIDSVVVFNEVHYHPPGEGEESGQLEFVELYNQNSVNVDLSDWTLGGVGDFVFPAGTTIEGRGYLVVAKDPAALEVATGFAGALGPFIGNLANDGERLVLRNHNARSMDILEYEDSFPWPSGPDGSGATLSKRRVLDVSGPAENWATSRARHGTPGGPNDTDADGLTVVFSEVPALPATPDGEFWIELQNTGGSAVSLEGLLLTDADGGAVELSEEINVAPGAFHVVSLDESPFSLTEGRRLFLWDSVRDEFIDSVIFRETLQARAEAETDPPRLFAADAPTPGEANLVSFREDIVINEIFYHHPPRYENPDVPGSVYEEVDEEWIELFNRSEEEVDLSGWRLEGGIRFVFPEGTALAPGAFLVVADHVDRLAEKHPDIAIVGDLQGSLSNQGERIELQEANGNPVDAVHYLDDRPWPANADGGGSSLELRHPDMNNARAEAWAASDESARSEWRTYSYRATAIQPVYSAGVRNFHELRVGFLDAGSCLIDNVSVIEDPDGSRSEMIRNGTFGSLFAPINSGSWLLLGNHGRSEAISDPDHGAVLRIVATSSMNYLNNLCEAALRAPVETGKEYEVRFDAKWLSGSPQLRTEVYYNKFARKTVLAMPETQGTPGAVNSRYEENPGPTFGSLRHEPAIPAAGEAVTVSVEAEDPDGLAELTLFYQVEEGEWQTVPMNAAEGRFRATIPGQGGGNVVAFYVEGTDGAGAASVHPAEGPEAGTLYRSESPLSTSTKQSVVMVLRDSDATALHRPADILSNERRFGTMVLNGEEIFYNIGIRLRGSMFSRSNGADAGLNIQFPADHPFRGAQSTFTIRRRNVQEILVKHMANQARNVGASYNDLVEWRGYMGGQTGTARIEMARFGKLYLRGAYDTAEDQTLYKMEGIRDFQSTDASGMKLPMPIGWIQSFDFADLGDDREQYRHVIRINENRDKDDYGPIIRMCKAFDAPNATLREAVEEVIDVDQWARMMAIQTLCGIADVYPIENPHNFNLHVRPTDEKILAIPWDWDFTFNLSASERIYDPRNSRKNLWRILQTPGISRLYEGHLLDLTNTIFNESYAAPWFQHYGEVAGGNYNSFVNYVRDRAASVRSQVSSSTPFAITTNGGSDFSVGESHAVIRGTGDIRVRTLRHEETGHHYEPDWIDDETWELSLPLAAGENAITLKALDYQGLAGTLFNPMGMDSITVTNTGETEAAGAVNLLVTEIMYHPAAPDAEELAAGFVDQDRFEFIELTNIGANPVDSSALRFTEGIRFDFALADEPRLEPGESGLLVADRDAFVTRYGESMNILGVYEGNLANDGERLELRGEGDVLIHALAWEDDEPWPVAADGDGYSLSLIGAEAGVDLADPAAWKASSDRGGSPGRLETGEDLGFDAWVAQHFTPAQLLETAIVGELADPDGDGLSNLVEFALGRLPMQAETTAPLLAIQPDGEAALEVVYEVAQGVTGVEVRLETSKKLVEWGVPAEGELTLIEQQAGGPGRQRLVFRWSGSEAAGAAGYVRLRVER